MIELRMAAGDFSQMRFAYSPVSEAIDSLNMLRTGLCTRCIVAGLTWLANACEAFIRRCCARSFPPAGWC